MSTFSTARRQSASVYSSQPGEGRRLSTLALPEGLPFSERRMANWLSVAGRPRDQNGKWGHLAPDAGEDELRTVKGMQRPTMRANKRLDSCLRPLDIVHSVLTTSPVHRIRRAPPDPAHPSPRALHSGGERPHPESEAYLSPPTALAMTSKETMSAELAWMPMSSLARLDKGIVSVGLKAELLVSDT